jgi:uncharacterized Zn finger protein
MSREELVESLSASERKTVPGKAAAKAKSRGKEQDSTLDLSKFWDGDPLPGDFFGDQIIPQVSAALPKRLGSFPLWRGKVRFLDMMEMIYSQASPVGLRVLLGEQSDSPSP